MKSYSETVFPKDEIALRDRAERMVEAIPEMKIIIRCHELSRAVGRVLGLQNQDERYGFVEHSWLWTKPLLKGRLDELLRMDVPDILDVYSVGQLPMVRLVDARHVQLPHISFAYQPGEPRFDVDEALVRKLAKIMRKIG